MKAVNETISTSLYKLFSDFKIGNQLLLLGLLIKLKMILRI